MNYFLNLTSPMLLFFLFDSHQQLLLKLLHSDADRWYTYHEYETVFCSQKANSKGTKLFFWRFVY